MDITPAEARALLVSGDFMPSQGLGWGLHWRARDGRHLRLSLSGVWTCHRDEVDPRGGAMALLAHVLFDVIGL